MTTYSGSAVPVTICTDQLNLNKVSGNSCSSSSFKLAQQWGVAVNNDIVYIAHSSGVKYCTDPDLQSASCTDVPNDKFGYSRPYALAFSGGRAYIITYSQVYICDNPDELAADTSCTGYGSFSGAHGIAVYP